MNEESMFADSKIHLYTNCCVSIHSSQFIQSIEASLANDLKYSYLCHSYVTKIYDLAISR